jgi:hypothetical protein
MRQISNQNNLVLEEARRKQACKYTAFFGKCNNEFCRKAKSDHYGADHRCLNPAEAAAAVWEAEVGTNQFLVPSAQRPPESRKGGFSAFRSPLTYLSHKSYETTYLSGGADSASTSNMQWPAVAPSESRKGGFSAFRFPMTPHTAISTSSATPAAGTLQMGSDNTPSVPAPALTLDTFQPSAQRPPQSSDWMEPTTPPGTPPGEPPEYLDDSPADAYVRGEFVYAVGVGAAGNGERLAGRVQMLNA